MTKVTVHTETNGQWKTTKPCSSPSHNHDSAAPRQHPLIWTAAGPIHPVHGQPMSLATKAIPRNEVTFSPFLRAFYSVSMVCLYLLLRGVLIRISKNKCKRVCTSHTEFVTNLRHLWRSQTVTNLNLWPNLFLRFLFSFFSKTGLITFWSNKSQMVILSDVTSTNMFMFTFYGNGSEWNEIQTKITECDLCLCSMFGIQIRTALHANMTYKNVPRHESSPTPSTTVTIDCSNADFDLFKTYYICVSNSMGPP